MRTAGTPRILFVWPTLISLTCVLTKVSFSYQQFNLSGAPVRFDAKLTIEEIRDVLITMEEVDEVGSRRTSFGREGA